MTLDRKRRLGRAYDRLVTTARATWPPRVEAVTVDAYMTLIRLVDPVPALRAILRERGVERSEAAVAEAFDAEVRHYGPRSHTARDAASLAALQEECAGVFLSTLGAALDTREFAPAFTAVLRFEPLPGVTRALSAVRTHGVRLAVVSNWDMTLPDHLRRAGLLDFVDAVVTAAEAGVRKPDPRIFELALERLGAAPDRAIHIGDAQADADGARAAGMRFAWAPLTDAVAAIA